MGKAHVIVGNPSTARVGPATAEDAAFEYFHSRATAGAWAARPPVERWRPDERERFEKELARLEAERLAQMEAAAKAARERPVG